ncbi:hypothetical protein EJB05_36943 [Eragrostis curvula]|uniref:Transposase Tnp1/En/Spm-like domain-containing protein n=1 Tax=Eragrostis curvula TaxID=38414 RepID=A0A5J9U0T8_9POAL|nr:hypothetical protein EJB05_36943 [Eragrostis curvula]
MAILARKKAESENASLKNQLGQMQARVNLEQRGQQDRSSAEPMSQNCSTSRLHVDARLDQIFDEEPEQEEGEEDYHSGDDEWDNDHEDEANPPRSDDVARSEHDALVGKDVILFAMIRDQPVAKGTIISTMPTTIVDDQAIGRQFCEVIVTHVLKRDAILPRPYNGLDTMGDAHMMNLAWPYKRVIN